MTIDLLKFSAKLVTFWRKWVTHCNTLFRHVSFSLHFFLLTCIFSDAEIVHLHVSYFFLMKLIKT
jgi:hypothetical protein